MKKENITSSKSISEIKDENIGDAIKLLLNSRFKSYELASTFLGLKSEQALRSYLNQLSNKKGNLSKVNSWLDDLGFEMTYILRLKEGEGDSFPIKRFDNYLSEKKFSSAEKLLIRHSKALLEEEDLKLELELKLERARSRKEEESLIPLYLSKEALDRVMKFDSPKGFSGRVNELIQREFISDKDLKIIKDRFDKAKKQSGVIPSDEVAEEELMSKLEGWKESRNVEVSCPREYNTIEETVVISKRVFVLLYKEDDKLVEITDLFTTTFLREACTMKNKSELKVTSLTKLEEENVKVTVSYKGQEYDASVLLKDKKPKKVSLQKGESVQ